VSRPRRGPAALTSAFALVAGTLAAQSTPAQAQQEPPATSEPASASAQPFVLEGLGKGPHTITLITGDKVKLTGTGGGRYAVQSQGGTRQDGRAASLFVQSSPKGVYALPDDALPAVQAGRLDRELFNVKYLAENGYTDELTKQLPVIVQYPEGEAAAKVKSAAGAIPASAPTTTLESINAAALDVSKAEAGAFWAAVRTSNRRALSGGISKVWLDRKVKADLAESVPMIGAPQAWPAATTARAYGSRCWTPASTPGTPISPGRSQTPARSSPARRSRTVTGTAPTWPPPSPAAERRPAAGTRAWRPARSC
jgi:hypothetical protein